MRRPRKGVGTSSLGRRHGTTQRRALSAKTLTLLLGALVLIPVTIWVAVTYSVVFGGEDGGSGAGGGRQNVRHGPEEPGVRRRRRQREDGREARDRVSAGGRAADGMAGDGGKDGKEGGEDSIHGGAVAAVADEKAADSPAVDPAAAAVAVKEGTNQKRAGNGGGAAAAVQTAPTERVVEFLLRLARMSTSDLREALKKADDGSSGDDPFQLAKLKKGQCPWEGGVPTVVDWLPSRPPLQPSEWFRTRHHNANLGGDPPPRRPTVAVYYEHLSKAGGTSFCKLAQTNMPRKDVPSYYCMPSEPGMVDARVGSWTTDKLAKYLSDKPHRLVSNEWEPFNLDFLTFQATSESGLAETMGGGDPNKGRPLLLFVTSIRDPINRLLSAHKFWGILHNDEKVKPSLGTWLKRHGKRTKLWKILSGDFAANVGRYNFATWKFSGGALPNSSEEEAEEMLNTDKDKGGGGGGAKKTGPTLQKEDAWLEPFQTAVRTLSRFDLMIPMELLSDHPKPITDLLGWTKFEKSHVVPSGKVMNNDASSELTDEQYDALWDVNWLDVILYHWACAVYLARVHCADVIMDTTSAKT